MEKSSKGSGNESIELYPARRERRITAEERATGTRPRAIDYTRRSQGIMVGTYTVQCDACHGVGHIRIAQRPFEICIKCDGEGFLTINGDRKDDKFDREQPSWSDVAVFVVLTIAVITIACVAIITRAGGW
jgi:hypothetical protein